MNEIDNIILKGLEDGKTQREIANDLNISDGAVSQRVIKMKRMGVEIKRNMKSNSKVEEFNNKILEGLAERKTQREIAQDLGVKEGVISYRIKQMKANGVGLPLVKPLRIKKKQNDETDNIILEGLANGKSQNELAKDLNISTQRVSQRIKAMKERGVVIPDSSKKRNDELDNKILAFLAERKSHEKIAKEIGKSYGTVVNRMRKMRERGVEFPNDTLDDRILEELKKGKTQKEIGKAVGFVQTAVSQRLQKMRDRGIEVPVPPQKKINGALSIEYNNRIIEELKKGKTQTEIANELGITQASVSQRIKQIINQGIDIPKNTNRKIRGNRINNIILEGLAEGKKQKDIANELGYQPVTISKRIKEMREKGIEIPDSSKKRSYELDNKILAGLAEGKSQKEIADELHISRSLVGKEIMKMRKKGIEVPTDVKRIIEREEILIKLKEGKTQTEIVNELDLTYSIVIHRIKEMKELGIEIPKIQRGRRGNPKKTENDETDNLILVLLDEKKSQTEIAEELDVSPVTIARRIKGMRERGVEVPTISKGKTGKPKRTENDELDNRILEVLEEGKSQSEVSKELGVPYSTVSKRIKKMDERENQKLAKMIVNLINTKHASVEQVRIMGEYYEVDVEEALRSLDEQER